MMRAFTLSMKNASSSVSRLEKFLKMKKIESMPVDGTPEIRLQCPDCKVSQRKYEDFKLYFNVTKKTGFCQRCKWKGGFEQLLRALNASGFVNTVPSLKELKNALKGKDDGKDSAMLRGRNENERSSILPKGIIPAWKHKKARRYLYKRGLGRKQIERYGIFYCPVGYFAKRIIIPVFDEAGNYKTFVARDITGRAEQKYLYPKGCRVGQLLYNLDSIRKERRRLVWLVEGVFDAYHVRPYGCATFGKHITNKQIDLLRESGIRKVVILWDWDAAHDGASHRIPSNSHNVTEHRSTNGRNSVRRKSAEMERRRLHSVDRAGRLLQKAGFKVGIVRLPKKETDPTNYKMKDLKRWASKALKYIPEQ